MYAVESLHVMSCHVHVHVDRANAGMSHATCVKHACNIRPVFCLKKVRKRYETDITLL